MFVSRASAAFVLLPVLAAACGSGGKHAGRTDGGASRTSTPPGRTSGAGGTIASAVTHSPRLAHLGRAGGAGAASGLRARTGCSAATRRPFALLAWTPASVRGSGQLVAVTLFPQELSKHVYKDTRRLAAGRSSVRWTRLHGQAIHYWIVLTRHPGRWTPSRVARFKGPSCPVDFAKP